MLESLGKIQNPLIRSLTAALTVGSVITLGAAVAIGFTNPKDDAAYKTGVYASLLGAGGGAIFGLVYSSKTKEQQSSQLGSIASEPVRESQNWQDWRNFVVVRKVKESEEITSFYLKPQDRGPIPNFQPGQYLTIKLDIPGELKPLIRTYSLSDYPEPCEYYRLSIKREPTPKGLDVPPGRASNFMHDQIQEGSVLICISKPKTSKVVLDL